ncbi:DUF1360 domain-containing protein [Quadrisphaera sp. KR29]|uniref:DUF1360 domain-containing protein n=1 Tax=Quadrisphaera sp. KR29 TaxID=3461391 RepID=UPI004044ECCC
MTADDADLRLAQAAHTHAGPLAGVARWWLRTRREYEKLGTDPDDRDERPLTGYALLMGGYAVSTITAATVLARRRRGAALPGPADLALMSVAVFRTTRTLSKDAVLSPLRAPFTVFSGPAGPGEVLEQPREGAVRHAVGELVTCPFCLGQWVATAALLSHAAAPRATRWVTTGMTVVAAADALQYAYAALEKTDG